MKNYEEYIVSCKVEIKQRVSNSEFISLNGLYDLYLPDILGIYASYRGSYIEEIIDKLCMLGGENLSILLTDEGQSNLKAQLEKNILKFMKESISSKAKKVFEWYDFSGNNLSVYIKRI